jgi:predicted amidohydrolase YtcJ
MPPPIRMILDHRARLEPGIVAGQALSDRRRSRRGGGDRPVWLGRVDGHASGRQQRGDADCRRDRGDQDPVGGKVERDAAGNPTGLFIDAAEELVASKVPPPTAAQLDEALMPRSRTLLSYGITATADMGTSVEEWNSYRRAGEAGG